MFSVQNIPEDNVSLQKTDSEACIFVHSDCYISIIDKIDNLLVFVDNEVFQAVLGDKHTIRQFQRNQDVDIDNQLIKYVFMKISNQKGNQKYTKVPIMKIPHQIISQVHKNFILNEQGDVFYVHRIAQTNRGLENMQAPEHYEMVIISQEGYVLKTFLTIQNLQQYKIIPKDMLFGNDFEFYDFENVLNQIFYQL